MECSGLSLDVVPEESVHGVAGNDAGASWETSMTTRKRKASSKVRSGKTRTTISRASKQQRLIEMLGRPAGATIAQLGETLGWQAHSVRGAISGALKRKLGLKVVCDKDEGGERLYRIV